MSVKGKIGLIALMCVFAISVLYWYTQNEPYSAERVVDSVLDKFEVQSMQFGEQGDIGEESFVIWIDVYDKNDIPKVEKYLEDNLSKEDLTKYEIDVFSNKGIHY
jgi:hypothetical protein